MEEGWIEWKIKGESIGKIVRRRRKSETKEGNNKPWTTRSRDERKRSNTKKK